VPSHGNLVVSTWLADTFATKSAGCQSGFVRTRRSVLSVRKLDAWVRIWRSDLADACVGSSAPQPPNALLHLGVGWAYTKSPAESVAGLSVTQKVGFFV
jgi:hypothetical protein